MITCTVLMYCTIKRPLAVETRRQPSNIARVTDYFCFYIEDTVMSACFIPRSRREQCGPLKITNFTLCIDYYIICILSQYSTVL